MPGPDIWRYRPLPEPDTGAGGRGGRGGGGEGGKRKKGPEKPQEPEIDYGLLQQQLIGALTRYADPHEAAMIEADQPDEVRRLNAATTAEVVRFLDLTERLQTEGARAGKVWERYDENTFRVITRTALYLPSSQRGEPRLQIAVTDTALMIPEAAQLYLPRGSRRQDVDELRQDIESERIDLRVQGAFNEETAELTDLIDRSMRILGQQGERDAEMNRMLMALYGPDFMREHRDDALDVAKRLHAEELTKLQRTPITMTEFQLQHFNPAAGQRGSSRGTVGFALVNFINRRSQVFPMDVTAPGGKPLFDTPLLEGQPMRRSLEARPVGIFDTLPTRQVAESEWGRLGKKLLDLVPEE